MNRILHLEKELAPLRTQLKEHKLYTLLEDIEDIQLFMQEHVFAVWDFMSLLKSLQRELTCISTPWTPKANAKIARFINEIVLEEETDINELGEPKSHFEMYIDAMLQTKANITEIATFISNIIDNETVKKSLQSVNISKETKDFVSFTFEIIQTKEPHIIASCFTFGREDLIPDMFLEIIKHTEAEKKVSLEKLTYYLNRHIELDGEEHGPLAIQMIKELCQDNEQKWNDVLYYAKTSLEKRINLWNGIAQRLKNNKEKKNTLKR